MRHLLKYAVLTMSLSSTACVADLQRDAAEVARKRCAEQGLQFVETDLIDKGGVFGVAGVVGECVGADDPRLAKR